MGPAGCPFLAVEQVLPLVRQETPLIVVDMHGEATSEKVGMGWFLDGKVSAVVGSHTPGPTADRTIPPGRAGGQSGWGRGGARALRPRHAGRSSAASLSQPDACAVRRRRRAGADPGHDHRRRRGDRAGDGNLPSARAGDHMTAAEQAALLSRNAEKVYPEGAL